MLNRTALIALLLLGAANVAAAQQASSVNVNRLPLDLQKLQHDLRQSAANQSENHGLKISYRVDVYGQAPHIDLFTKEDNLQSAAVPYGGPTHQEMMNVHTRAFDGRDPAYRAPAVMDFNSVLTWLADKTRKK
jgi:hypothetical protein